MFADVTFSTEGIVIIAGLLTSLVTALVFIFKLLMSAKDAALELYIEQTKEQMKKEESQKKSYKEIAEEAVKMVEIRIDKEGKKTVKDVVPVVPEHSSPVTPEQQETAELQTLRARVTAATLALDLPARESGKPEVQPEAVAEVKEILKEVKAGIDELPKKIVDKIKEEG